MKRVRRRHVHVSAQEVEKVQAKPCQVHQAPPLLQLHEEVDIATLPSLTSGHGAEDAGTDHPASPHRSGDHFSQLVEVRAHDAPNLRRQRTTCNLPGGGPRFLHARLPGLLKRRNGPLGPSTSGPGPQGLRQGDLRQTQRFQKLILQSLARMDEDRALGARYRDCIRVVDELTENTSWEARCRSVNTPQIIGRDPSSAVLVSTLTHDVATLSCADGAKRRPAPAAGIRLRSSAFRTLDLCIQQQAGARYQASP